MKVFMNTKNIHIILVLMTLVMFGCSDKKDSSSSCLNQLNEEKYQQVAENSNCSQMRLHSLSDVSIQQRTCPDKFAGQQGSRAEISAKLQR